MQHKQFLIKPNKTKNEEFKSYLQTFMDVMFTHITSKDGIKHFREVAMLSMIKDFKQLDEGAVPGRPVVIHTDPELLTRYLKTSI